MRGLRERLADVLAAVDRIEQAVGRGKDVFFEDEYVQVWIIHHIEIIGEAVRAVSDQLLDRCPEYPWARVIGMRNILVHDYFGIDLGEVWAAVEKDIPELKKTIERILDDPDYGV